MELKSHNNTNVQGTIKFVSETETNFMSPKDSENLFWESELYKVEVEILPCLTSSHERIDSWLGLILSPDWKTANKQIQVIGTKYWGGLLLSEPGYYSSEENRKVSK